MARLKEYDGHYCESEYEYAFNVSACEGNPNRIQKAMVVCSNRKIAYELLQKFQDKYSEWFVEKQSPDGVPVTEELKEYEWNK